MLFQTTLCIVPISGIWLSSYIWTGKPGPAYYGMVFTTGILRVKVLTFTVRTVPAVDVAIRICRRNSYQTQTFRMEFVHNFLSFLTLAFFKFCTEHDSDIAMAPVLRNIKKRLKNPIPLDIDKVCFGQICYIETSQWVSFDNMD